MINEKHLISMVQGFFFFLESSSASLSLRGLPYLPESKRAGNNTIHHMRGGRRLCSLTPRTTNSAVATARATAAPWPPSPPATPPLPPPPPPPPPQSVGRSVGRAQWWGLLLQSGSVRPTDGPTAPSRSSFQVVEVELVAHLPTDWKEGEVERGGRKRRATGFGLRGRSSLFQGKK